MIYEDIAAAVAVALFIWLVPVRRNGIPWLRGRGSFRRARRPHASGSRRLPPGTPGRDDRAAGRQPGDGRDERVLAELDATWDAGYADREAARHQSRKKSA